MNDIHPQQITRLHRNLTEAPASLEIPHPTLPGAVLVLWIYPEWSSAAWRIRGKTFWEGLPCEA